MNLRNLPSVDEVLEDPEIQSLKSAGSPQFLTGLVRGELEKQRQMMREHPDEVARAQLKSEIVAGVVRRFGHIREGSLRRVINATGVVLHTNLGRAPLPARAAWHGADLGTAYGNLEFDLERGERGSRYDHVTGLLQQITGCEAALVVNNNAAAVLLALNTLVSGKEVIVSRGQLVEIGGSFRIPEIMRLSGARMVEVGTTNKTYPGDFEKAINESTALLLSVHTSNYRIIGFASQVSVRELNRIGQEKGIPVMHDLGSGSLLDLSPYGLAAEPTVGQSLSMGAGVVTFSGDKLLGGPQAGIIVGKKEHVDKMKQNQLLRALRVDKTAISTLEATLALYLEPDPTSKIPVLAMITADKATLQERALKLAAAIKRDAASPLRMDVIETIDRVGGGAYPMEDLPGYAVCIEISSPDKAACLLRKETPPVLARIKDDSLLFSVRTLLSGDDDLLAGSIARTVKEMSICKE